MNDQIEEIVASKGADGKLLYGPEGDIYRVNLVRKDSLYPAGQNFPILFLTQVYGLIPNDPNGMMPIMPWLGMVLQW